MPAASRSLDRFDDNLVQCIIHAASFDTCQALALTCRRFCQLVSPAADTAWRRVYACSIRAVTHANWLQVRRARASKLALSEAHEQQLAAMPRWRRYQIVEHLELTGEVKGT